MPKSRSSELTAARKLGLGLAVQLGQRGERPVAFNVGRASDDPLVEAILAIPGVGYRHPGVITCAWDAAAIIAEQLGVEAPTPPIYGGIDLPGLEAYYAMGFREKARDYQKDAALFLARRSWAILSLPMRLGKSLSALMTAVLVGSKHTLVAAPKLAKLVWVDEIFKWTKKGALILDGRGGRTARKLCTTCGGRRRLDGDVPCPDCKGKNGQSLGYLIYDVRRVSSPVVQKTEDGARYSPWPRTYRCVVHHDATSTDPKDYCTKCQRAFTRVLESAEYVVVNYDVLTAQAVNLGGGIRAVRSDLLGWADVLAKCKFDVCIGDESHILRGRPTRTRRKKDRRSRFKVATKRIPRVYLLTGTPVFGYLRDLYGQLDAASDGLFGTKHYGFDARYCNGHLNSHGGWEANGESVLATTELKRRLALIMYKKSREELLGEQPAKIRQIVHIDPEGKTPKFVQKPKQTRRGAVINALCDTLAYKIDTIVENVMQEMAEGNRVVVFTFLRKNAETVVEALDAAIKAPGYKTRMRAVDAKTWLAYGDVTPKARLEMARAFREHEGAGAFVATVDAFREGGSLAGASSAHFADLHYQPMAMLQAESRPCEVGVQGFQIVYYVLRNSFDEHIEENILPKVDTLARVMEEKGAEEMHDVFDHAEDETIEDLWNRLTAHLDDEDDED